MSELGLETILHCQGKVKDTVIVLRQYTWERGGGGSFGSGPTPTPKDRDVKNKGLARARPRELGVEVE